MLHARYSDRKKIEPRRKWLPRAEADGWSTPFQLPLRVDSGWSGIDGIAAWCIPGVWSISKAAMKLEGRWPLPHCWGSGARQGRQGTETRWSSILPGVPRS